MEVVYPGDAAICVGSKIEAYRCDRLKNRCDQFDDRTPRPRDSKWMLVRKEANSFGLEALRLLRSSSDLALINF